MGIIVASQAFVDLEANNRERRKHQPGWSADVYHCNVPTGSDAQAIIPKEGYYVPIVGVTVPSGTTILGPFVAKDGISYGKTDERNVRVVTVTLIRFNQYTG